MTNEQEQDRTTPRSLTDSQRTRIEFARRDLEHSRSEDLAQLGADGLVLLVERLRGRLDDTLQVIAEAGLR